MKWLVRYEQFQGGSVGGQGDLTIGERCPSARIDPVDASDWDAENSSPECSDRV